MKYLNKSMAMIVTLVGVAVCIVMLIGGISLQKSVARQNATYTGTAEATVVDYEVRQEEFETTDSQNNTTTTIEDMYYPIFSYTVDGQEYRTVSNTGSGSKAYEEGTTLSINYLPEDPSEFYIQGDTTRSVLPYILYAISAVCLVVSVKTGFGVMKAK